MPEFVLRTPIPVSAPDLFAWHARPGALERLTPPWENVRLLSRSGGIRDQGRVELSVPMGPFRKRWIAQHGNYTEGRSFLDVQLSGPFAKWEHTHSMIPEGTNSCILEDRIQYRLPFGPIGSGLGSGIARSKLEQMFAYRHHVTLNDLSLHTRHQGVLPMKIAISGSTGLVGSSLVPFLTTGGHSVTRLVRSKTSNCTEPTIVWHPALGQLDADAIAGHDAVVHLAGENIAGGRWTAAMKKRIRDSRVQGTRLLCERLAALENPPKTFVCASAIGYYGDRGAEELTEESSPGTGFLPEVCQEWEAATEPARAAGIRVVQLRFGVILSPAGGALAKMLLPFKMGAGGILGNGKQYMSWIALDDAVGVVHHALMETSVQGPVNVVAPRAVTNHEYTKTLGKVLSRPTIFPVPAFAARLAFGEMADALLLASAKVVPAQLQQANYEFLYPELEAALRHLLGKEQAPHPQAAKSA